MAKTLKEMLQEAAANRVNNEGKTLTQQVTEKKLADRNNISNRLKLEELLKPYKSNKEEIEAEVEKTNNQNKWKPSRTIQKAKAILAAGSASKIPILDYVSQMAGVGGDLYTGMRYDLQGDRENAESDYAQALVGTTAFIPALQRFGVTKMLNNYLDASDITQGIDETGETNVTPTYIDNTQLYKKPILEPKYAGGTGKKGVRPSVSEDIEKDPNIKGPIGYLNSYYNSPEYVNRGGYLPDYNNTMAKTYRPLIDEGDEGKSYVNRLGNTLVLAPKEAKKYGMDLINDVLPHEYSHLTKALTYPEATQIANLNRNKAASSILKKWHDGNYGWKDNFGFSDLMYGKDLTEGHNVDPHTIGPHENYADLNALRYMMYKQGIYDTRKGPMSMEHLQKAMNDPYIKKELLFKRMLENFTPENIVELNNKVAKNKEITPSFKNGGTVMPTPKTRKIPTIKEVPDFNKQQYDDMAEWNYYMEPLRNKLKAKNPDTFDQFTQGVTQARTSGNQFGRYELAGIAGGFKQNPLTEEEIQASLAEVKPYGEQNPYDRFNALKNQYFAYDETGYSKRPQANPGLDYNQIYPLRTSSYGSPDYEYTPQIINGQLVVNNQPVNQPRLRPKTEVAGQGYAMGSRGVPSRHIKVTDGEFGITPQGQQGEFQGQGGIDNVDAEVPVGTKIFSDSIKLDGKTMSDRAKFRASRESKIQKILDNDDKDAIAKNTLKRVKEQNKMQEQQDLQYQEMLSAPQYPEEQDIPQFAGGGYVGDDEYEEGSWIRGLPIQGAANQFTLMGDSLYGNEMRNPYVKGSITAGNGFRNPSQIQPLSGQPIDSSQGYSYDAIGDRWGQYMPQQYPVNLGPTRGYMGGGWYPGKPAPIEEAQGMTPFSTTGNFNSAFGTQPNRGINASNLYTAPPSTYTGGNPVAGINPVALDKPMGGADIDFAKALQDVPMGDIQNQLGGVEGIEKAGGMGTAGNIAGGIGTAIGAIGPILSTLANKRATKPNVNHWKGYGHDAIDTNYAAEDALNFQQNENAIDNAISRNTANQQIDNSTSSLNVGRAMKAASNYAADRNANLGNATFANQRSSIFDKRAQMLTERDRMEMQGKAAADLADRQDVDAFYGNLNRDIGNLGTSFQEYGRTLNQNQYNQDYLDIMPDTSQYGFGYQRRNGRFKQTTKR